jgi:hypothetical protein
MHVLHVCRWIISRNALWDATMQAWGTMVSHMVALLPPWGRCQCRSSHDSRRAVRFQARDNHSPAAQSRCCYSRRSCFQGWVVEAPDMDGFPAVSSSLIGCELLHHHINLFHYCCTESSAPRAVRYLPTLLDMQFLLELPVDKKWF